MDEHKEQQDDRINVPEEDTEVCLTPEEAAEEAAEEVVEDRVFGMPRVCFRGAALGLAAGYILCGVVSMIVDKTLSATMFGLVCAGLGYLIAKRLHDKRSGQGEK